MSQITAASTIEADLKFFREFLKRMQEKYPDPGTVSEILVQQHVPKQGIWSVRVNHTPIYPRRRRNPPIGAVKV